MTADSFEKQRNRCSIAGAMADDPDPTPRQIITVALQDPKELEVRRNLGPTKIVFAGPEDDHYRFIAWVDEKDWVPFRLWLQTYVEGRT